MNNPKPRLVIDCRMINMSGIGRYIRNVLPGLIQSGKFEISCLVYKEMAAAELISGVKQIIVKAKILSLAEQFELVKAIPQCDVFWSPNWNVPLFPVKSRRRLVTIHDVYHLANQGAYSPLIIGIVKIFMRFISRRYKRVITVSAFSKNEIIKHTTIAADKIKVIPLGIEEGFDDIPDTAGITESYILFVGNIKPNKNLLLALSAFKDINNKAIKFYIVGKREGFITKDGSLESIVGEMGDRIVFTGEVTDAQLKNYYKNAALFLFPSLYEGFGLPVLEAMKFGLPIVASNAASIPEVAGNKVTYFNPKDKAQLTFVLNEFFDDPSNANRRVDYQSYLENFSWQNTVDRHIDVLIDLLK